MKSLTYPGSHTVNYLYNTAGRALSAIDSSIPNKYVTAATYAPHGEVSGYLNGVTSSFAGIQTTNTWNSRFQPLSFVAATLGSGAHTVMSLSFNFNLGTSDNGTLVKITNNVNTGRNTNYLYDKLNRIVAGWHDATDWGTQYTIDIWGNLTQKAPCNNSVGCPPLTMGEGFSAAANGNNQLVGYSYDASGNLQNDQLGHTFVYDAENRPRSETTGSTTVTYYYDGEGERVAKSSGKLYFFGTNSAPLVETDTTGATTAQYIFFDGKRVAMRKPDNSAHYYFVDQIGSANIVTDATASTVEQDIEYHPYGEQQVYVDTSGQEYRFTGHEHDPETNDDYFGARYYSSAMGRFLTPDWAATPVPIPYAVMGNPQTLNLYSYVENNPITGTDPDGHAAGSPSPYIGDGAGYYACLQGGGNCSAPPPSPPPPPPPPSANATNQAPKLAQNTAGAQDTGQQQNGTAAQGAGQAGGQQGLQNQQLKFKTVSGGQGTTWEIQWSLTHNTKIGGWIVQHIVADFAGAGHYDYWESWPVSANSHVSSLHGTDANGASYSDMFAGGSGSHIHASAQFYEGLTLPSSFKVQPAGFPAGILKTTTTNPNLSTQRATTPNVRWWGD